MATTADFRNGLCIKWNKAVYIILQFQHVKPGKGGAFVRTKLKNLDSGKIVENTFTSGVKIETARIERRKYQYLYSDDMGYHFMNMINFEQIVISEKLIPNHDLIKDGQEVEILYYVEEGRVLTCELPPFINLKITETTSAVKGDTVGAATKAAILETGAVIQVPLFVNQAEIIKIDTRTRTYSERIKYQP